MNAAATPTPATAPVNRLTIDRQTFDQALHDYRIARAELDLDIVKSQAEFTETQDLSDATECETEKLCNAHSAAMLKVLMSPAVTPKQLLAKIEVYAAEEVIDMYYRAAEVTALLVCDARNLLSGEGS